MKSVTVKRLFAFLLALMMLLSLGGEFTLHASAASGSTELPDLSAFLGGRKYTQNVKGKFTYYVTCTYDKDEGTKPLEEFLSLLQEDRYQLKLVETSKSYKDSYSSATCKDYFFHYTGTSSKIQLISTTSGSTYHVRVTLYTYTDKDYSAIVYYREPDFTMKDSGVHYGDKAGKTIPALSDYFTTAESKKNGKGEIDYIFSFSTLPSTRMSNFSKALQKLDIDATERLSFKNGSRLQVFCIDEEICITVWWHDDDKELEVTVYDQVLKSAGYSQKTTRVVKDKEEVTPTNPPSGGSSSGGSSGGGSSGGSSSNNSNQNRWRFCTNCSSGKVKCSKCDGVGYKEEKVSVPNYSGSKSGSKWTTKKEYCSCSFGKVTCPDCDGSGKIYY